jgi:hypothetical protein
MAKTVSFGWICSRFLFAGGLAVLVCYISRIYFEDPFLHLKERWAK